MRCSNKLLDTCDGPSCESIPKRRTPTRSLRFPLFAIALAISLSSICAQSQPQNQLQERLQAIFQMSAEEMAATSAFTRRGYEGQLAYAYRIQNKQIRDIVLDFMLKPAATAFGQPATQSWLASPGSGWKSHHAYPGGLSIHNLEWVEVASAWVDTYEKVYGVKLDRDLVIAGLILHDWGKLWFLFDDGSGKIQEPEWYPKAWGTKAKWKWMGGHGAVLYAELIHRGAPKELLFAAASAHFDPHWGLETDGEGLNPAMSEAAAIARKPVPLVNPEQRLAEWWIVTFTDEAWSFSTMVAAKFAFEVIEGVTKDLGLKSDSREANKSRGLSSPVSVILRFTRSTRRLGLAVRPRRSSCGQFLRIRLHMRYRSIRHEVSGQSYRSGADEIRSRHKPDYRQSVALPPMQHKPR
jgi:hypothetical protein